MKSSKFIIFLVLIFVLAISTFGMPEPETCGNNETNPGESVYNCNKDIETGFSDMVDCLFKKEECTYFGFYLLIFKSFAVILAVVKA